ncbi:MAG: hypothetical protein M4579_004179 [Chaenotheca gracillima]|nr:MAG: hypothetical protein M4579_004179 [Chaenotheca gracillima]
MLSRKKSNASAHLRHTHSASSVGSSYRRSPVKFEPVDPQVSHQQAVAAATLAYKRSFDRNSGPRDESDGIQRRPSTVNSDSAQKPILPRKQSVRFVTSAASSHHRSQADDFDTRKYRLSTDSSVRSDTRARSRTVTGSYSSSTMVASELEQQYLPQSTVASAPSSYRRLQKSKSMSNTRQATSEAFEGLKRGRSMRSSGTGERPSPKRNILKKPKSMSFLRERFASNSILDRQNQDAAVQMARENYTQQMESQKNTDSSSTTGSRARRQSKGFRKSLRSTSISSYGDPIASPAAQANFRPKYSFAAKARDFSASLKYRIKCAFNRSENRSDNPHQDHSGEEEEGIRSGTGIEKPGIEVAPSPDPSSHEVELSSPREGYSASLKSRLPSDLVEPSKKFRSAVGSIRGDYVESDSLNDRSRVTSWTNSTPAATIGPRGRENMRSMSVIREDGSLFDQPWADNDDEVGPKTYAAFNQPMPGTDHSIPQEPVDSHRVYSALRRKLGDEESSHDLKSVPRASAGSVQSNHSSNTIRQEHSAWDSASRAPIERFSASGEPESQRFSYARSPTPPLDVQRAPFVNPDESGLHAPKPSPELLRLNENHSRADTTSVEDLSASIRSRAAPIIRQKQSGFSQYAAQDYLDEIANIPIMNEDSPSQDKGLRRGSQYSPSKTPPGSVFDSRATAEHWPHDVDGSLALPRQIVDESYRVPAMPNEPSDPAPPWSGRRSSLLEAPLV